MRLFVTGTDTGAGKTYVTALLLRALRSQGVDAVGMKPICAGARDDAEALHAASDAVEPLNVVNPVWYRTPAAPYTAAVIEDRPVDLALIRENYKSLCERHACVVVEGVGGWLVPVTREMSVADLAEEMEARVVVVVKNRLGALNHALLTIEAIHRRGLPFAGYILNHPETAASPEETVAAATNASILTELLGVPPLLTIEPGQSALEEGAITLASLSAANP